MRDLPGNYIESLLAANPEMTLMDAMYFYGFPIDGGQELRDSHGVRGEFVDDSSYCCDECERGLDCVYEDSPIAQWERELLDNTGTTSVAFRIRDEALESGGSAFAAYLQAIKAVRAHRNWDLRTAKNFVEDLGITY